MGPGKSLFDAIFRAVGKINIVAEDLVCFTILRFYRTQSLVIFSFILYFEGTAQVES